MRETNCRALCFSLVFKAPPTIASEGRRENTLIFGLLPFRLPRNSLTSSLMSLPSAVVTNSEEEVGKNSGTGEPMGLPPEWLAMGPKRPQSVTAVPPLPANTASASTSVPRRYVPCDPGSTAIPLDLSPMSCPPEVPLGRDWTRNTL